jgi:hypothetical protein
VNYQDGDLAARPDHSGRISREICLVAFRLAVPLVAFNKAVVHVVVSWLGSNC